MNKQRGYTLIEIGIVLVVASMMASWLAVNYFQVSHDARNKEAERAIVSIKKAIVSYAADHPVNSSYWVVNASVRLTVQLRWRMPAGRPYLPCPDITGDGLENRQAFPLGTLIVNQLNLTQLDDGGNCYANKGLLPWKTLGVPPNDPWGNLYGYRVAEWFSSALVGFDQETRNDQQLYSNHDLLKLSRVFIPPRGLYPPRTFVGGRMYSLRGVNPLVLRSVPVAGTSLTVAWREAARDLRNELDPSIICTSAPCGTTGTYTGTLTLVAGVINYESNLILKTGGYDVTTGVFSEYRARDIVEGLPVVIVSHGQNGHGAMYVKNARNGTPELACRDIPLIALDEGQNAFWAGNYQGLRGGGCNNIGAGRRGADITAELFFNRQVRGGIAGFVSRPPSNVGQPFDDIVGWMSTDELTEAMEERGVFPVGLLPPFGLEN